MRPPVLEVRNITKQFPGVLANDHISFTLFAGEIHAFLGENGAGKSTLMNILYGLYDPDEGEIFINGRRSHKGPNADPHGLFMSTLTSCLCPPSGAETSCSARITNGPP